MPCKPQAAVVRPLRAHARASIPPASLVAEGPCRDQLATDERRDELGAMRVGAAARQRASDDVHGDEGPGLHVSTDLLGDDRRIDDPLAADASSAELLGNQHREPPELGRLAQPAAVVSDRVVVEVAGARQRQLGLDEPDRRVVEERLIVAQRHLHRPIQ